MKKLQALAPVALMKASLACQKMDSDKRYRRIAKVLFISHRPNASVYNVAKLTHQPWGTWEIAMYDMPWCGNKLAIRQKLFLLALLH